MADLWEDEPPLATKAIALANRLIGKLGFDPHLGIFLIYPSSQNYTGTACRTSTGSPVKLKARTSVIFTLTICPFS